MPDPTTEGSVPHDREPDDPVEAATLDAVMVLGQLLTPASDRPCQIDDLPGGAGVLGGEDANGTSVAVIWTYRGRHDERRLGIDPTGVDVVAHGVTVVSGEPGARRYRRFIDWMHVYEQIGLTLGTRPMVPSEDTGAGLPKSTV